MTTRIRRFTFATGFVGLLAWAGMSWGEVNTPVSQTLWDQLDLNKELTAQQAVNTLHQRMVLQSGNELRAIKIHVDRQGNTLTRIQLMHNSVPVADTGVIMRTDKNGNTRQTGAMPNIPLLKTTPTLTDANAKTIVQQSLAEIFIEAEKIKVELQIKLITEFKLKEGVESYLTASATDYEDKIVGSRLIYRATVFVFDTSGPHNYVFEIDAHSGEVLLRHDNLDRFTMTANTSLFSTETTEPEPTTSSFTLVPVDDPGKKIGNARSQYSGLVTVPTPSVYPGQYFLGKSDIILTPRGPVVDVLIEVLSYEGDSRSDLGYEDASEFTIDEENYIWGNGANYTQDDIATADPTHSRHGQTAAVDALYGAMVTWDMWKNVFNHTGLDGNGEMPFNIAVHVGARITPEGEERISSFFSNGIAYFPDPFHDGKQWLSPDIVGHEFGHGFFNNAVGFDYNRFGEPGGIGEANADIMGTLAEFYESIYPNDAGNTIPETGGNWTIGEKTQPLGRPVRFMYKPSKDLEYKDVEQSSFDYWFPGMDVETMGSHRAAGPMNRMFYFLSQGVEPEWSDLNSEFGSIYMPDGMTGIGIHKAGKIWYRAIKEYLRPPFKFESMRRACEDAAAYEYGNFSLEQKAVQDAFAAVFVGPPAERTPPTITISTSGWRGSQTLHVNLVDVSGAEGGDIHVTMKNAYGLETNIGAGFIGDSGSLYLGNVSQHLFKVRVTASDTDGNESHKTKWFDYEKPVIEDFNCTGGRTSHGGWQHYADVRTCSVTVTDAMSINRLEFETPEDISGVVYRHWWQEPPGIDGTTVAPGGTLCEGACGTPAWPFPVSHTFEFEADLSNITAPGGTNYTVKAKVYDNAGNGTSANGFVDLRVDEWPPEVNLGLDVYSGEIELRATVFDGSNYVHVKFYIDGIPVCEDSGSTDSWGLFKLSCRHDSTRLSNTTHSYSVTAKDYWDYSTTRSMTFNVDDPNECAQTTRFTESEPNGAGNPDIVPPCTGKVKGFWHNVNTYPVDADYFRYRLGPGQSISFSGGWNCTFDIDTLRRVHTNDTPSAVDFNFFIRTYSDTCSFGSYELTMDVVNSSTNRTSSESITALPTTAPGDVSGSGLRAWISNGNSITIDNMPAPMTF